MCYFVKGDGFVFVGFGVGDEVVDGVQLKARQSFSMTDRLILSYLPLVIRWARLLLMPCLVRKRPLSFTFRARKRASMLYLSMVWV